MSVTKCSYLFKSDLSWPLNFLQGVIFDFDKIRKEIPGVDVFKCIGIIHDNIPREAYSYAAAGDVDGELTMVLVFKAGNDEEYLRKTLKIPDNDILRQAVKSFMKPGVWPTHR